MCAPVWTLISTRPTLTAEPSAILATKRKSYGVSPGQTGMPFDTGREMSWMRIAVT